MCASAGAVMPALRVFSADAPHLGSSMSWHVNYRKVGLLQLTDATLSTLRENVVDALSSEHT